MSNRIALWFSSIDQLLAQSPAAISAEQERLKACPFSEDNPLLVWLERDLIRTVVEASVRQFTEALQREDMPVEIRAEIQQHIEQRNAFSAWLNNENARVYVQLAPARLLEAT